MSMTRTSYSPDPKTMAVMWRATGLGTDGGRGSPWPAVRAAAVYSAYACLCVAYALQVGRNEPSGGGGGHDPSRHRSAGSLQIRVIRMTDMALLFVAATAVYWCAAACRGEHGRARAEYEAVARRLFGSADSAAVVGGRTAASRRAAADACCWTLYALLAAAVALDAHRYAGPAPWTYAAARAVGHYALLTGNVQFAVTVFALRRCYAELNGRMRSGGGGGQAVVHDETGDTTATSVNVLDRVNLLTMLKYWSDLHWTITQTVSRVNNLFKFRLFVFFLCGLLHLMVTPYVLSLIILNEDIDILRYILEYTLWFTIHILRMVLMIYPCALLGEEAAKTQILLGSYLNTKIDYFDIKRIETYAQHLAANTPEFSIYGMFIVDKQLVVTLTGAVATYLVIILQLQGQS